MDKLQFRISTGLKNIIGKELITNQYVAIFELVKNSYDAYAERVDVYFENDKIIIQDDGKWMTLDDIKNKWLFVGYSAKADETENEKYGDYRNKINIRKGFAWAKWIGRFACDALGNKMNLVTKSEEHHSQIEKLSIDWTQFESDRKNEFQSVDAIHETLSNDKDIGSHGTKIEITWLLHSWENQEIEKLKTHLAKLISPFKGTNEDNFEIIFHISGVEQKVENFVFQNLWLKTVHIKSELISEWKYIQTSLIDRGEKIYTITENNKYNIDWIDINLFFLTTAAKSFFNKNIKVSSVEFGSIFVYKNGFRIFPYGEPWEDSFWLDARKTQWYARFIGTREIIWSIEIQDQNNIFKETSSRDWGFINSLEYIQLKDFLLENIKKLEKYLVDIISWTYIRDEDKEVIPSQRKQEIKWLIEKLSWSKNIVSFDYKPDIESFISEKVEKEWYEWAKKKIETYAKDNDNKEIKDALKVIEAWKQISDEKNKELEESLKKEIDVNSSLKNFVSNPNFKNIVSYYHDIELAASNIDKILQKSFLLISDWNLKKLENFLENVKFENNKILSIAKIATRSWVKDNTSKTEKDLVSFIKEYLLSNSFWIVFKLDNSDIIFHHKFKNYDIVTIFDNLISNSKKFEANNITIWFELNEDTLQIKFSDNWNGLDNQFLSNPERIFDFRVGSTNGSWLWLFHVKDIVEKNWGIISVVPEKKGLTFYITFNKWN